MCLEMSLWVPMRREICLSKLTFWQKNLPAGEFCKLAYTLCIIGNGFDLHHQIPSSYAEFQQFVKKRDATVYELVERFLTHDDSFWNEFEASLAYFDAASALENSMEFLVSYSADDWRDANHHSVQFEAERIAEGLSKGLKNRFCEWINELPIPAPNKAPNQLQLPPKTRYLSFNYTPTLQQVYGIPDIDVLHIHGRADNGGSNLVLGHDRCVSDRTLLAPGLDYEEQDTRIAEASHIIDDYFEATFKPTAKVIDKYKLFFISLSTIRKIFIMGHSLADVDLPYFETIARHVDMPSTVWHVSYHTEKDRKNAKNFLKKIGVPKTMRHTFQLSELNFT